MTPLPILAEFIFWPSVPCLAIARVLGRNYHVLYAVLSNGEFFVELECTSVIPVLL